MNKLKLKDKIISILTYVVFILALWYTVWTITGGDDSRGDLLIGISRQWYFSNQSNTLVVIATGLFWLRLNDKKWFKYFASIVATNIFITATGYHFILQHPDGISFYGHLGHTYVPIAYILWYFLSVKALKLKMFWINIIYPLTYLFLVIYVTKTWPLGQYPYGFLDPTDLAFNPDGINSVLRFTLTIMFPAYLFVAFLMTLLKSMIERKKKTKKGKEINMEPQKTNPNDTGGFGVGLLGFIFPIIGLILYLVWKDNKPISANAAGTGALIGFVVEVIFFADIIAAFL